MTDEIQVGENEHFKFFRTSMTEIYTRRVNEYNAKGLTFPDRMVVYECVPKDGGKPSYVVFDTKGKPYLEFTDPWDLDFRLGALMMKFEEENDIINMAKKEEGRGMTELKPCPFCGNDHLMHYRYPSKSTPSDKGDMFRIMCGCGCIFDQHISELYHRMERVTGDWIDVTEDDLWVRMCVKWNRRVNE